MADNVTQGLLLGLWAIAFMIAVTVAFVRSLLSFRYWVGWLTLSVVLLGVSALVALLPSDREVLGLSPTGIGFAAFQLVTVLVAVQLSISISGHRRMLTAVTQECAELRYRVDELEADSADGSASGDAPSGGAASDGAASGGAASGGAASGGGASGGAADRGG
jgi:uncharacterized membrane protein YgcG